MWERTGFIIGISGVVLLLKPNLDPDQIAIYFNYFVGNYRPAILIIIGLPLVSPKKKKTGGRSKQVPPDKNDAFYIIREQRVGGSMKKTYFIDLDGTMYCGSQIIKGAREFIDTLTKRGECSVFLTNNAKRTKRQNVEHMEQMEFTGIRKEHFFTSSMAAARYVTVHCEGRNVWYIRQDGLREALENNGFIVTEQDIDLVFAGLDNTGTYEKYPRALGFLLKGAKLIGTNNDRLLAQPGGLAVGNGSIVAIFEHVSGQISPKIGKSHAPILEEALKYFQLNANEAVILGDNLETDILLSVENHMDIVLATSGVRQCEDAEKLQIHSTRTTDDLRELLAE